MNPLRIIWRSVFSIVSLSFVLCSVLMLSLVSCANDMNAQIRAINLSPDVDSIDVFDGEGMLFRSINYSEASDYNSISAKLRKSHDIKVTPSNSFTVLSDHSKTFTKKKDYTLFLFNFGEKAETIYALDDNSKPSSNRSKLRFVNGSPSNKSIDVYITVPEDSIEGLLPTLEGVSFKNISDYLENIDGEYRVRVTLKGDSVVIADSGAVSLSSGKIYTIAFIENVGGGAPFDIVVFLDK